MANIEKKSFNTPDETNTPGEKLKVEIVSGAGVKIAKVTAEPGWRWSKHLKPVVKTESCEMNHLIYMLSGILASKSNDGKEVQFGPGEIGDIPPGHDGWTVGDEAAVWLEFLH
jgi:hypothetical protein